MNFKKIGIDLLLRELRGERDEDLGLLLAHDAPDARRLYVEELVLASLGIEEARQRDRLEALRPIGVGISKELVVRDKVAGAFAGAFTIVLLAAVAWLFVFGDDTWPGWSAISIAGIGYAVTIAATVTGGIVGWRHA